MKAPRKTADKETAEAPEAAVDPFAADFFGVELRKKPEENPADSFAFAYKPQNRQSSDWFKKLPKISNLEAQFSASLQNLPKNLTKNAANIIAESIARYTFRPPDGIECSVISIKETALNEAVAIRSAAPQVYLTLGCQNGTSPALLTLNTEFASTVIGLILGEDTARHTHRQQLSPVETTIVEFLTANILGEINRHLEKPIFCLQTVENQSRNFFDAAVWGAELTILLQARDFNGVLSIFAPQKFLDDLSKRHNPMLARVDDRTSLDGAAKIIKNADLNLQVGTTQLTVEEISVLEAADIVIIENPKISLETPLATEQFQINVGQSQSFRLLGNLALDAGGNFNFTVREILSEVRRRAFTPVKIRMEQREEFLPDGEAADTANDDVETAAPEAENAALSPAIENMQIAVRVEMAATKMSLRELQDLRAGQIIALGCQPSDPVRLVSAGNDEPLAIGELVEIEGQLGVRLSKVFV